MQHARLYAILDLGYTPASRAESVTIDLLAGGADLLQLRAKGHSPDEIRGIASRILPICRNAGVPFILNDFPEIAAEIAADGVHIGQEDGSLEHAKSFFPATNRDTGLKILFGRSTHSLEQARAALAEGFDYIGFGPLFPTPTKAGRPAIGLFDVAAMERDVGRHIPAFCIGGIKRSNLGEVTAAGARRVVIVSDLLTAADVKTATRDVVTLLAALAQTNPSTHAPTHGD